MGREGEFQPVKPIKVDLSMPEDVIQDGEELTEAPAPPNTQTSATKTKAATSTKVPDLLKRTPASQASHKSVAQTQNHLTILQQGIQAWNQWRQEHPDTRPELAGAQLSGVNLQGVNLQGANLSRANLSMADLSNADLGGADLRWANMTGANLQGANLSKASLTNARLIDTTLTNTQLRNSDLRGALFDNTSFTGTTLNGAHLYRTVFGDVDLSAAQGLEQVRHWGPSMLGMEAIARSKGSLPVAFLRGVGVPDPLLPHIHSLVSTVTCFISYAHEDLAFVKSLEADLQQSGVRCWLDPDHTKKGEIYSRADDKLLIVLSAHSHTTAWLSSEVEFILQKQAQLGKRLLFLLRLDNAAMPTSEPRAYYTIDFTPWQDPRTYHEALSQLLSELKV
jgi:TIR domain-containing protein/pentapeptide repeat protein